MNGLQRARTALFLTRLLLFVLVLALVLVLAAGGARAVPPPLVCPYTSESGLPFYMAVPQLNGRMKCVYGLPAAQPCASVSLDGRALKFAKVRPNGRVKCVYGRGEGG